MKATMINHMLFYLQNAGRNLRRGGRWTSFAVFSIAAGVATVVALRSLGLAIEDSLIANVRATNHGDITIAERSSGGRLSFSFSGDDDDEYFPIRDVNRVQEWVDGQGGRMAAYIVASNLQVTAFDFDAVGRPQFINSFLIDPQTFPPTGDIEAVEPRGAPLRELLTGDYDVVISKNLADSQGIEVGDTVRVSNTTQEFHVRGIAPTEAEANLRDPFSAFFGFAYFHIDLVDALQIDPGPNRISITLPEGADIAAKAREARQLISIRTTVRTVPELLEVNREIADFVNSFIVVMGLGALLIGGVGIMNTMLVMIRRRTMEIATLKTFGLNGRQVAGLFTAEALLLGAVGSMLGVIIGLLLSGAVNQYGEAFLQQPLVWRFHPEVILFGLGLGVTVTVVFGVLPILTTTKIRPAIILRPNEQRLPGTGILHALVALLLITVIIGLIAGRILTPALTVAGGGAPQLPPQVVGILGVGATLTIIGVLVGLLWLVVWALSHLPTFGSVDLRLALRNLTTRRVRTATTLLALSVGMFALSSIVFWGAGLRDILRVQLAENFGGNVMLAPLLPAEIARPLIDNHIDGLEGVTYRTRIVDHGDARLTAIDGQTLRGEAALDLPNPVVRDSDNPHLSSGPLIAGRDLTPADRGQRIAVIENTAALADAGLRLGSTITLRTGRGNVDLEVAGLIAEDATGIRFGNLFVPPGVLPNAGSDFELTVLQVEPEHLNEVLLSLSTVPLVFAFDITFIDGLLKRLIDQMSAIPTLVGLLSLGAAAVIMANTVSLATLERRRQIGVLKAIGLKGQRVLRIMLLENTLIGLVGAALGVGISALGTGIMTRLGIGQVIPIPSGAWLTAIGLVIAAILIAWLATFLSARVAIGERVLNVLRYD